MITSPLFFTPIPVARVWGGRRLEDKFHRTLPAGVNVGESWEIADRPEACSVIEEGPLAGMTLRTAIETHAASLLGPAADSRKPFPLLVKWLDCRDRLSLQVHPPAGVAISLDGEPKSELWYVVEASPQAGVFAGFKAGTTSRDFLEALSAGVVERCVCHRPMTAGDSLFVPSGRIHAIDGGSLVLEIQQNSDTTYRVHDWNRRDADGVSRALHIDASMRSIDFADFEPEPLRAASLARLGGVMADCREFRVRRWSMRPDDEAVVLPAREAPRLLHVVAGEVVLRADCGETHVPAGRQVLLPWAGAFSLSVKTSAVFVLTDRFL